jgi:anti-sigma-K factor RskA
LNERELRELLGAYALGALEEDERGQVERFLLREPDARSELHALQLGAAWLARSAPRPSANVWSRIATEVEHDLVRDNTAQSIPSPLRPRVSRRRLLTLAAAVVALLATTLGVVELIGTGGSSRDVALSRALQSAERSPDARFVDLLAPDGAGSARVVVLPDGRGFVISAALPRLDDRQTYQLWALTGSGPVSGGLLGRTPGVHPFRYPRGTSALAITAERAGGSRAPNGQAVAIGALGAA